MFSVDNRFFSIQGQFKVFNLYFYGKVQCGTLHLVLVVFLKLFILGHSEIVLAVTNLPCRSIIVISILSILLPEDKCFTLIINFRLDGTFSDEGRNIEIHPNAS